MVVLAFRFYYQNKVQLLKYPSLKLIIAPLCDKILINQNSTNENLTLHYFFERNEREGRKRDKGGSRGKGCREKEGREEGREREE